MLLPTGGCAGLKFNSVQVEREKLILRLDGLFEVVFALDFKLSGYEHCTLQLYDFKVLIESMGDEYTIYGHEFDSS